MLEQLRRNSRSFIIWVLFIIIIAAFALTFGSQGGLEMNCQGDSSYAMSVDEEEVPTASLRFAMNTLTGPRAQRAQQALDMILMREILAQAGQEAGFKTDYKIAAAYLRRGEIFLFGNPQKNVFVDDDEQFFDYERMKMTVEGWGISVDQFIAEQERELLAYAMRGLITESAGASSDEARARFEHENTTATIEAVKFRPSSYRTKLELTEARIQAYLAGHEAEVRDKYEQDERLYQGVGEQVKIRQIVFKRVAPAAGEPSGEAPVAPQASAAAPAAPPADDPGLVAAKQAHEKLVQGMDFAALAAERSEDERSRAKGGDLGWRSRKTPGMGAKELSDALQVLEPGQISEVIETPNGFYILKVEGKREGDLSFDQVKTEIAERLAGQYYAKELARRAANQALAEAKAGKMLSDLFEQQARTPGLDPAQLPPELLQQLTPEQLQQLLQPQGGEEGRLQLESRDIPASALWQGAEPGAAADQPAPATPVAADKPAVAAQPAVSAGSAAPAPEPTPTADIDIPADVAKPKLVKIGPFTRDIDGSIAQLGKSKELMSTIFDRLKIGQLAPEVYEVDGDFVLVQMVERKNPNLDELDAKKQEELMHDIARERGYLLLSSWLKERCTKLRDAGEIKVNQSLLTALAESPDQPILYTPCSAFP